MTEEEIKKILGRGKDLRGKKFNKLTPLYPLPERVCKNIVWHCKCDCGNECDVISAHLSSNHTKSCGCQAVENGKIQGSKKFIDLTGQTFGKLTVLKRVEDYILPSDPSQKRVQYLCECSCENHTKIKVLADNLKKGNTMSCGCIGKSKGEQIISQILTENKIFYEQQKIFKNCKFSDTNYYARFDFYVNNHYIIEYDGEQHFRYRNNYGWNTEENFKKVQEHDKFKNQWCKDNNIPLIRIPYTHLNDLCLDDLMLETSNFIIKGN